MRELTMSIKARLEDAMILWDQGRKEGAWALVLIAAAATSRKRYPRPMKDNDSFKRFIHDVQGTIVQGEHPSPPMDTIMLAGVPMEDVIYEHMRCNLVHEAELNQRVALSESKVVHGLLGAELRVGAINELPDFWVIHLAKAVRLAPENASEFTTAPSVSGSWAIW
jgi:hypothetical protein